MTVAKEAWRSRRRGPRPGTVAGTAVLTGLLLASVSGCTGANPGTAEAGAAALDFHTALASGDYGRACGLLIPPAVEKLEAGAAGTCAEKLSQLDVPAAVSVKNSAAYGRNAQVVMDQDTLFLARSGDGWRITAAGCTSRGERPYDCEVEGD
jgi:FlaG/FlaF family flagellin (archaellin)